MLHRIAFLAAVLSSAVSAQFSGLSSTADGSSLYFTSTLRLKGSDQPRNGKIFIATQEGVKLFTGRERADLPPHSPLCTVGGFSEYVRAETSSAGVVALFYRATSTGGCSYQPNTNFTQIVMRSGDITLPGVARLSPDGRYAISFSTIGARPSNSFSVVFLDLQTGAQTTAAINSTPFPQYLLPPNNGGRVIANDGTALVALTDGSTQNRGYILKPGADPKPFPVQDGLPLIIDADAAKVLYQNQGLRLLDLHTLETTLLIPQDKSPDYAAPLNMSDDARLLLFIRRGQAHLLNTASLMDRALTNDSTKITEATISADGKVVYAVTSRGGLLKINTDDGSQVELIGRTPWLEPTFAPVLRGFATSLGGSGLSDSVLNATPPLDPYLGNVTMWMGEEKVPIVQLAPNMVRFLVPWDFPAAREPVRICTEALGDHTPFDFPEVEAVVSGPTTLAGAIARENWERTYVGPVNTGEIIHVFAMGLGPVFPEVPTGAAAPSAEPLSRITRPFTCSNAEVLYAGLAPGAVERVYQIDFRIGPTPGYQQFTCTLGGAAPFIFLTLNVTSPAAHAVP